VSLTPRLEWSGRESFHRIPQRPEDDLSLARAFRLLLHHPAVRALLDACAGSECHLVGGILRDRALGLPSHDVDAVVAGGAGRAIAERLAAALPARLVLLGGKEFAAYRLVAGELTIDLWDRGGATLHADLERRDFTVDSFALDARSGEVTDPFDGLGDLERRRLRATTRESFAGDPLRVLRLPRLLLHLPGFAADPETLLLARRTAPRLAEVSAERVRTELAALFAHPEAHRGLALLVALDLYPGLWLGAPGEAGRPEGAIAELEALPERLRELRETDAGAADAVDAPAARFAAAFAHLPQRDGRAPLDRLAAFRDAGYLTRQEAAKVALLLSWEEIPESGLGRRRFLHRAGPLWPTALCSLGARAAGRAAVERWRAHLRPLVELARREGAALFDPPRLLTGGEVAELLRVPPGPQVGKALAAVRQAQVDGWVRTREEALALLLDKAKKNL
jgi:tRNA nucleotidyltransferase/poly(A) polymerase